MVHILPDLENYKETSILLRTTYETKIETNCNVIYNRLLKHLDL